MILARQLSWTTTFTLAWIMFGAILLGIETSAEVEERKKNPGRRHHTKYKRKWRRLMVGWLVYFFVIAAILTMKGN